jgi:hypothetical protein
MAVAAFRLARDGTLSSKLPRFIATNGRKVTMAGPVLLRSGGQNKRLDGDEITRISHR